MMLKPGYRIYCVRKGRLKMFYGLYNRILCVLKGRRVFYAHKKGPDLNLIIFKLSEYAICASLLYMAVRTSYGSDKAHVLLYLIQ